MSERGSVRVEMSPRQAELLEQVEAAAVAAVAKRDLVLQTIAASVNMEGSYRFAGIDEQDGLHFLVLAPA